MTYYERLTEALFAIEKPRDEDMKFLQLGLKVFPGSDWVRVGTAALDFRLGRGDNAMATLDTVLRAESTLDPSERAYANSLRINWLLEAMKKDVEAAVDRKDFVTARAAITRCRESAGDDSNATTYLQDVNNSVDIGELVAKYNAALQARKKSEARSVAQQLLARPNLPISMRNFFLKQVGDAPGSSAR